MPLLRHRIQTSIATILVCVAWVVAARGVEKNSSYRAAIESIKAEELTAQVEQLAGPAMEGREAGTKGGQAAGEYIAKQFARLHLQGAGDDGTFFQPFDDGLRNVLAIVPGSDPKLRDQTIVVGAHYDHVGLGGGGLSLSGYGEIHPGADDNASGTSAVIELAKALTILTPKPKRSIVLAAWDGEEKGLLGSKHWVAHPTVPLDRVAAVVNLDMVGRLRDNHLQVFGVRSGSGWRRLVSSQNDETGLKLDFSWDLQSKSDHYLFFDRGIPVIMFHTGLHDNLHRSTDTAKLINGSGMAQVTRLLLGVVCELADRPAVPEYRAAARHESPETEKEIDQQTFRPTDRLGVEWVEDAAKTGGVVVSDVRPESPAAEAGLLEGDRIVRFAGRDIRSDDDFFGAVSGADSPAPIRIKRPGTEKPIELKVSLDGHPLRWGIVWRVDEAEPGALILSRIVPGSPAATAGLRPGDRVYQAAGHDFADEAEFLRLVKSHAETLTLLIERDGRLRVVTLQRDIAEPMRRAA